jgi:hypothetical protein
MWGPPHPGIARSTVLRTVAISSAGVLLVVIVGAIVFGLHLFKSEPAGPGAAATPAPSASPSPAFGWTAYANPRWAYTMQYPATWYDVQTASPQDTNKYFSNEHINGPYEMTEAGFWLSIKTFERPGIDCKNEPSRGTTSQQSSATMGGLPATRWVGQSSPGAPERWWTIIYSVSRPKGCHVFEFLTRNQQTRDMVLETADRMISTVKFAD